MNKDMNHVSIGMKAPDFSAMTSMGPLKMSDFKGKWVVFFSHPGDFTPVAKGRKYIDIEFTCIQCLCYCLV